MPSSIGLWYGPTSSSPRCISARAAGVHALRDLVVLDAGLPVGGLLGLDELALEGGDLLGVEELDHVERLLRALAGCSVETTSTCGYHSTITFG